MRELLERIAIKGTDNRRLAITKILDENNIPYELQEIKHEHIDYSKMYERKSPYDPTYEDLIELGKVPNLEDDFLNSFIEEDIYENLSPSEEDYEDEFFDEEDYLDEDYDIDLLTVYGMMGYMSYRETLRDRFYENLEKRNKPTYSTEYLYNIIIKPSKEFYESKNKILFSAHYDVVTGSTGSNDNGSSIAILLKLAINLYKSNTNLPIGIVFFDGEERGGIGSKAYINEFLSTQESKDALTLINLDVCGCGSNIVIVDSILNRENASTILLSDINRKRYRIKEAKSFPFSDASIFNRNDIGTLSISVFPQEDIDLLEEEQRNPYSYKDFKEKSSELKLRRHFGSHIWSYMHNGKYDDIKYINYEIMELVYSYIINCLEIE